MPDLDTQPWDPMKPEDIASHFEGSGVRWWLAGGLAIDRFLGWETRSHADVDIEMMRRDRDALFDIFEGWDLHAISQGRAMPLNRGDSLPHEVFGIWGRPTSTEPWAIEIILADGDDTMWRFRRDPEITLPADRLTRQTSTGISYCTPEVQLLYKAKQHRPKDDADMVRCLHRLTTNQLTWLVEALHVTEPDHPWIDLIGHRLGTGIN